MSMPRWTMLLSVLLIVLGLGSWLGTGRQSVTALIPAFLGIALGQCALWARRERARATAMHVAAVLALVGFGGTVSGAIKALRMLGGASFERPEAIVAQAVVAALCLAYLGLAIGSFRRARRNRSVPGA